ncbi:MAG: N-acetylmuramyl-L-alanine amidase, negative regulator of AmpC, AmpD [Verrucomicrobiales bacterium]|nr:N-acetylmuramyl-L-alanine amidase, negative regulator of AmpC, AmpD [Verrucomicrobiales bacterium]
MASADYGPAIWRPICEANWYTSGSGHKFHVVHDIEGYYASTVSWFSSCGMRSASVHYAINGKQDATSDAQPGEITQLGVTEANYAWHAICWNQHSTGTEHEGFANNPAWYTEPMYVASAGLTRHIADKFGYAKDRNHIVAHGQKSVPGWSAWASGNLGIDPNCNTHTDPGPYWDWSHYMALINPTPPPPVILQTVAYGPAALNADGRSEIWVVGTDNYVYHNWQTTPGGAWYGWQNMSAPGTQAKGVTVGKNLDGRLEAFVIGSDGAVWHSAQVSPGGGWGGWGSLGGGGGNISGVAAISNQDGRLEIFVVGSSGAVWHNWQTTPNGNWAGWYILANTLSSKAETPGVGINSDGRAQVFVNGVDGFPYTTAQTVANGGWGNWVTLGGGGGNKSGFTAARNLDGRLEVYTVGGDNGVWHNYQTSPGGGWAGWTSFGGWLQPGQAPGANINSDGRLQIFANGASGVPYSMWQTTAGSGWTGWNSMGGGGGNQSRIVAGLIFDGRMEIFTKGGAGDLWHNWQTAPSGGWTGWYSLGGGINGL